MFERFRNTLQPIVDFFAFPFMWIHPNILTILTLVIGLPGFYFYTQGNALFGSLFILGAIFDVVDGTVARKTGKKTAFGGILDAAVDRIFDGLLLLSIGIGSLVSWPVLVLCIVGSFLISYIKAKAETITKESSVGKNKHSIGFMQRGDRLAVIFVLSFSSVILTNISFNLFEIGMVIMTLLVWINVLMRLWSTYRNVDH